MNDSVIIKDLDTSEDLLSQSSKHYSEMEEVGSPKRTCSQEEGKTICNACGLYYKLHKVKRNPNPIVLSKPLSGEVPAIEDYLGPQKKTAENSADVDNYYTPIKAAPSRASAPVSYSPILKIKPSLSCLTDFTTFYVQFTSFIVLLSIRRV